MNNYLDDEEKDIIESLHNDVWESDFSNVIKEEYQIYAQKSIKNYQEITFKIFDEDLKIIQEIAKENGISYKSLISNILHKFTNEKHKFQV